MSKCKEKVLQKLVERGSGEITMRKWRQKVEERKQNEKVVSSKQRLGGVELERKVSDMCRKQNESREKLR